MISVEVALSLPKRPPFSATTRIRVVRGVSLSRSMSIVRPAALALTVKPSSVRVSAVIGMASRAKVARAASCTESIGVAKVL
jgi:hypothetical protein